MSSVHQSMTGEDVLAGDDDAVSPLTRERLAAMQERAAAVAAAYATFRTWWETSDETVGVLRLHCTRPHRRRGKAPVVAKIYVHDSHYYLSIRFEWQARDFHVTPPWEREALLLSAATSQVSDEDLDRLRGGPGGGGDGDRWLADRPPAFVREILTLPGLAAARTLWARCPECGTVERWSASRLLDMTRRSVSTSA